jgi:hypothetical protein
VFLLSLVVFGLYIIWFVGLMFKTQRNELSYGKCVTVTGTVLCFYCYWLFRLI